MKKTKKQGELQRSLWGLIFFSSSFSSVLVAGVH